MSVHATTPLSNAELGDALIEVAHELVALALMRHHGLEAAYVQDEGRVVPQFPIHLLDLVHEALRALDFDGTVELCAGFGIAEDALMRTAVRRAWENRPKATD